MTLLLFVSLAANGQGSIWRDTSRTFTMKATYYADNFIGRKTTSGEVFTQDGYTAAHHSFPLHTLLLITNMKTGSQVIVKVNDRCPRSGVIDLSRRAAETIDITYRNGVAPVTVRIMGEEYMEFWRQQGEMREVMSAGAELGGSRDRTRARSATAMAGTKKQTKPATETTMSIADTVEEGVKPIVHDEGGCWNIVLCVVESQREANAAIGKLPIYHQENAAVITDIDNRCLLLTILVRQNYDQAEKTRRELSGMFPESRLERCSR